MKYILIENYTQATLTAKCHQHLTLVRIPYCGDICPYPIMVSVVIVNKTELGRFHLQQELFEGQLFRFEVFFGSQTPTTTTTTLPILGRTLHCTVDLLSYIVDPDY